MKLRKALNQEGQGLTEYAVILGAVIIVCLALTANKWELLFNGEILQMYTKIIERTGDLIQAVKG